MLATVHQPLSISAALPVLAAHLGQFDTTLREELAHCGVLSIQLDREAEIWIGVDQRSKPSVSSTSFKVLVVLEPPEVTKFCTEGFDLVLTWQTEHLRGLPFARLFVPATPWLLPVEWPRFHGAAKIPGLGFLRGGKRRTEGHQLRHLVWEARQSLVEAMQIPAHLEAGGVDRDGRNRQFFCEFVLVIENSRHDNYFTEKLLDALLARCVPVYWGCRNLSSFFDPSGVVEVAGGADEVLAACRQLTADDYVRRAGAVQRNFDLAARYAGDFGQRLERALQDCLSKPPFQVKAACNGKCFDDAPPQ